jgi:hypothetical protein
MRSATIEARSSADCILATRLSRVSAKACVGMRSSRRAGISFSGGSDIRARYRTQRTKQELTRSPNSYFASNNGRSRRKAPVADRGLGRLNWAESGPRPDGRNGRDCGPTTPPRSASCPPFATLADGQTPSARASLFAEEPRQFLDPVDLSEPLACLHRWDTALAEIRVHRDAPPRRGDRAC